MPPKKKAAEAEETQEVKEEGTPNDGVAPSNEEKPTAEQIADAEKAEKERAAGETDATEVIAEDKGWKLTCAAGVYTMVNANGQVVGTYADKDTAAREFQNMLRHVRR